MSRIYLCLILFYGLYQAIIGCIQLYNQIFSSKTNCIITGSLDNSGIYAVILAIIAPLALFNLLRPKEKKSRQKSFIDTIIRLISSFYLIVMPWEHPARQRLYRLLSPGHRLGRKRKMPGKWEHKPVHNEIMQFFGILQCAYGEYLLSRSGKSRTAILRILWKNSNNFFQKYAMMVKTVQKHSLRMRTIFSAFPIV